MNEFLEKCNPILLLMTSVFIATVVAFFVNYYIIPKIVDFFLALLIFPDDEIDKKDEEQP